MAKFMVETISVFRIRYVVEAKEAIHASDEVVMKNSDYKEFSQKHLNEIISSVREITDDEYLSIFDEDNEYLRGWTNEKKMAFVNEIQYNE